MGGWDDSDDECSRTNNGTTTNERSSSHPFSSVERSHPFSFVSIFFSFSFVLAARANKTESFYWECCAGFNEDQDNAINDTLKIRFSLIHVMIVYPLSGKPKPNRNK
jgi:hypothetical protein